MSIVKEKNQYDIQLDPRGYFNVKPPKVDKLIYVEYYNYDKKLLDVIKWYDARNIYWIILENN